MELHEFNMHLINELADKYGKVLLKDVDRIMRDCYFNDTATLVNEPQGEDNDEEYQLIKEVWCEQWSVGDSGDSFEGRLYAKIKDGVWLMLPFAM